MKQAVVEAKQSKVEDNMKLKLDREYKSFLEDIKERVRASQYEALKAVNKELITLYWDIGKRIVEKQEKLGWGKAVVENLAVDLQKEFPGIRGFSADNLWRMRKFYVQFEGDAKLAPLVQEISWTKIVVIMESCKDVREREFYINMTKKFGWTKDVLIHHIENQSFQKVLLNQTSFDKTVPAKIRNQAKLAVKDEYTFDFLELGVSTYSLKKSLPKTLKKYLPSSKDWAAKLDMTK